MQCRLWSYRNPALSPTIMPATTVSATELPPKRLKPCISQQADSPAEQVFNVGLWPMLVHHP
jgi:hypothetical protein